MLHLLCTSRFVCSKMYLPSSKSGVYQLSKSSGRMLTSLSSCLWRKTAPTGFSRPALAERTACPSKISMMPLTPGSEVGMLFSLGVLRCIWDGKSPSERTVESCGRDVARRGGCLMAASSGMRNVLRADSLLPSVECGGMEAKSCSPDFSRLCSLGPATDRKELSRDTPDTDGVPVLDLGSRSLVLTCVDSPVLDKRSRLPPPLSLLPLMPRSLPPMTLEIGTGCIIHITSSRRLTLVTVGGCISLIAGL